MPVTRVRAGEEATGAHDATWPRKKALAVEQGSVGLPIGVQVVARPWREDVALGVMAALEAAFRSGTDFPDAPPL